MWRCSLWTGSSGPSTAALWTCYTTPEDAMPLYHDRFDPRLQPQRSWLRRLLYIPPKRLRRQLERDGASRALARKAARRMRTRAAAAEYVAAEREYAAHADAVAWVAGHGFSRFQALCALRAFPDPAAARDHIAHQGHRAHWAGCRFCDDDAARRLLDAQGGHPAINLTPATPSATSRASLAPTTSRTSAPAGGGVERSDTLTSMRTVAHVN